MKELEELHYKDGVYPYTVTRSDGKKLTVQVRPDGEVLVYAPLGMALDEIRQFVWKHREWVRRRVSESRHIIVVKEYAPEEKARLREKARRVLRMRADYFAPLMGVRYRRISVREQKTLWGSCSEAGSLSFNWKLILAEPELLDYVVVHELAHLKQMNHSPAFWQEVEKVLPDYQERRAKLKKFRA